jgi:hypothetical protein
VSAGVTLTRSAANGGISEAGVARYPRLVIGVETAYSDGHESQCVATVAVEPFAVSRSCGKQLREFTGKTDGSLGGLRVGGHRRPMRVAVRGVEALLSRREEFGPFRAGVFTGGVQP